MSSATITPSAEPTATTPVPPASRSLVSVRQICLPVLKLNAATSPSRPAAKILSPADARPSPRRNFLPPPPTLALQSFWMRTEGLLMSVSSAGLSTFLSFESQALSANNAASRTRLNCFIRIPQAQQAAVYRRDRGSSGRAVRNRDDRCLPLRGPRGIP